VRCLFSAHRIHGLVVDHGKQPGGKGAAGWVVARELAPQHREYLLYDILGETLIAADPLGQMVRGAGVALIEEPHGLWITRVEPGEEVDVGWPASRLEHAARVVTVGQQQVRRVVQRCTKSPGTRQDRLDEATVSAFDSFTPASAPKP
jgi:hypothetical protein